MTVEKITQNITPLEATDKTNEVIDEVAAINASKADKSIFQVVDELPQSPDENTFYFIPENAL